MVRPSPPPIGWLTGFIDVPRLCGLRPIQRLRPALPRLMFMWSALPIVPIVARHSIGTRRTSPDGSVICAQSPSRAVSVALHPAHAADLAAAARLHLDVVDRHAQRDLPQRQAVADARLGLGAAHHVVARLQPVRGEDVRLLAVLVLEQGDAGRAVRVVLDRDDRGRHAVLLAA